ncbi:LytR/AlgR family response regulator transcription factor [Aquimarina sp. M1]
MLKTIVLDDEKKSRDLITYLLQIYCPEVEVVAQANDKHTFINALNKLQVDLVILDVEIGSITSFDILSEIPNINFRIIFVSSYDQYAIMGYRYKAIDYLLKPIDPDELIRVVQGINKVRHNTLNNVMDELKNLKDKVFESPKITISDNQGIHFINVNEILYCTGSGNYTTFILQDGNEVVSSRNLKFYEQKLTPYKFSRIHKSYLINLAHLSKVHKEQGGYVILNDITNLPISRHYKKQFFELLNRSF